MIISCFSRYSNELGFRLYCLNYCYISRLFLGHKKYMGIITLEGSLVGVTDCGGLPMVTS